MISNLHVLICICFENRNSRKETVLFSYTSFFFFIYYHIFEGRYWKACIICTLCNISRWLVHCVVIVQVKNLFVIISYVHISTFLKTCKFRVLLYTVFKYDVRFQMMIDNFNKNKWYMDVYPLYTLSLHT